MTKTDTLEIAEKCGAFIDCDELTGGETYINFNGEELEAFRAEIERMRWQPIETAPKDGSHVLLYKPEICYVGFWSGYHWCANARGVPVIEAPTHWMPLPAAPERSNAKEV